MKLVLFIATLFLAQPLAHGAEHQSIYFASFVHHFQSQAGTRNGSMDNIGYSAEYKIDQWQIEPGISTFIDSYNLRSFSAFADISHERLAYPYYRPLLSLTCVYKGVEYGSDARAVACYPFIKLRIGGDSKFFANIAPIPHVRGVTNGFIAIEFGYKW